MDKKYMPSMTIEDVENGHHQRFNSIYEKAALQQRGNYSHHQMAVMNHRRKCKSVAMTIFTLLCMTFCFLLLSYEYEPDSALHQKSGVHVLRTRLMGGTRFMPLPWHPQP